MVCSTLVTSARNQFVQMVSREDERQVHIASVTILE